MSLVTIYGVNGVGKDTVANELAKSRPGLYLTSESRMLMYLLGIIKDYSTGTPAGRDEYRALEDTPQDKMIELERTAYRELVSHISRTDRLVINLSHLVFALFVDKEVTFLDKRDIPKWYIKSNQALIQLTAPPELIRERRLKDGDIRYRSDFTEDDIAHHQSLCDKKWARLTGLAGSIPCRVIENVKLSQAVAETSEVVDGAIG